jgi:AAA domain, putative AbiEii toxin, Type IV TA system
MLDFQTPESELAAVNRRDSLQHPYFETLYSWGMGVRHFQFGTSLGKDRLLYLIKDKPSAFDPRNTAEVISIFRRGLDQFGNDFTDGIVSDMAAIGYKLTEIGVKPLESVTVTVEPPILSGELVGLYVKEHDLSGVTDQVDMSQGMFRALSVIIHLNYSERSEQPSCILIDDVGEGLDFDRSCALIDLLMQKAQHGGVQLIMSTNDRFVMNRVPLQFWSIIHRDRNVCRFFNYENSRDKFEAFKLTGMNNFDFFATDFVRSKFGEEISNLR